MFRVLASFVLIGHSLLAAAQETATDNELPVYTPEQIRADFEFMYDGLQSANFDLYAFTEPSDFETRYQEFREGFDQPMTRFDAEMAFQQFAALAHQAHTRVESDFSGFFAVTSSYVLTELFRLPGDVRLYTLMPMALSYL